MRRLAAERNLDGAAEAGIGNRHLAFLAKRTQGQAAGRLAVNLGCI